MRKTIINSKLALLAILATNSLFAAEMDVQYGVGFQASSFNGLSESIFPGISGRAWFNDKIGVELNLYRWESNERESFGTSFDNETTSTSINSAKFVYAPLVNDNSKFYFGLEIGNGETEYTYTSDSSPTQTAKVDYESTILLIGTEHSIPGREELRFSWEIGHQNAENSHNDSVNGFQSSSEITGFVVNIGGRYFFN